MNHCMKRFRVLVLLIAFGTILPLRAQEKVLSAEELSSSADVICIGKVDGVASEWNESRSMIRTRVTLVVDQYIKGSGQGPTLVLFVPGGEVDGVGEMYSHMATFKKDESVLVFAEKDRLGRYRVTGGQQGKLNISHDEATGKAMVGGSRPLEEITTIIQKAAHAQPQDQK
jgi:hypothetical protein